MGGRQVSGNSVPTISEGELDKDKENTFPGPVSYIPAPGRDSKGTPDLQPSATVGGGRGSERNSVASIPPTTLEGLPTAGDVSSNPSSPPRSTTSSGDRESHAGGSAQGGSIMMGSKPRPLRLMQESSKEDERARKQANRGS